MEDVCEFPLSATATSSRWLTPYGRVIPVRSRPRSGLECVARSSDRSDPHRVLLVGLELASKAVDVLGDGAGILPLAGRMPDRFEELLSREDLSWRGREKSQKIEFLCRQ